MGFVAPTVLKAFERVVFVWIGFIFFLCVAVARGGGGVMLIKLQQMEAIPPGASLMMIARDNNRLQTVMVPPNRNRTSSIPSSSMTGIVVPSHAANRGRDSFVGAFEVAVDTGLVLLGNDEGEYREGENGQK
jgi:hypothetical protein